MKFNQLQNDSFFSAKKYFPIISSAFLPFMNFTRNELKNSNNGNNKFKFNFNSLINKDKEKDLLISLDEQNQKYLSQNQNINNDNKINNVIQATNKLGEIFYRAAAKKKLIARCTS